MRYAYCAEHRESLQSTKTRTSSAKRRAANALLKAQSAGHPGGIYWIGVRHPLLHLMFYNIVEYDVARICVDGQDLPPVADDYKIQVRVAGRKSTRAVRIYVVGAHNIHWLDYASKVHGLRAGA